MSGPAPVTAATVTAAPVTPAPVTTAPVTTAPVTPAPVTAAGAPVAGYVEATTPNAVLGWAWIAGSAEPLAVELRLGEQVVAEAVADQPREDLARSGIGEGRHAFTLEVPPRLRGRVGELRVVARTPDGSVTPLGSPPLDDGLADRLDKLQRGIEIMVGSQRVLHRNVQAVLLKNGAAEAPTEASRAEASTALAEQITALELFVTRLDAQMAKMSERLTPPKAPSRVAFFAGFALAAAAFVLSVVSVLRAMPG